MVLKLLTAECKCLHLDIYINKTFKWIPPVHIEIWELHYCNSQIFPSVINKRTNLSNQSWIISCKTETQALDISACLLFFSILHIQMNSDRPRWGSLSFRVVHRRNSHLFCFWNGHNPTFLCRENNLHIDYILNLGNCHNKCRPFLHMALSLLTNVYLRCVSARWFTSMLNLHWPVSFISLFISFYVHFHLHL